METLKERDVEKLWSNYTKLITLLKSESFDKLIEEQGQRIIECSYSQRAKEPFCGIGGLVDYSLELLKVAKSLNKSLGYEISPSSLIKTCFISPLGKIGTEKYNRFVICNSDWHREKLGQFYDWNESCEKYVVQDMSLWYAHKYQIDLSWNEWQAILLSKDFMNDENRFYSDNRCRLAIILNMANQAVIKNEKDKIAGDYTLPF